MPELDFIDRIHTATQRDYLARVCSGKKTAYSIKARKFGKDYWDGSRETGYGGYRYDGRWRPFAKKIVYKYCLKKGKKVLDIGCGKGFLLYELIKLVPGLKIEGIDISKYAVKNCKPEISNFLKVGDACQLAEIPSNSYDLVLSINTLHNLSLNKLWIALMEIGRISSHQYIVVDSYRNPSELINFLNWQLTCESFFSKKEWEFIFKKTNYKGDWSFVYFP